ncbi:hypothetical protein [Azospirillum rugosum]|uniref:Ni/Co efflux regulator RcnB n=2 Tax=Azospirillum rugosum TaxID=416170 RepID=A0ABS4SD51_9PROT|nr:hypothetical protein [Azospirillum rugosum]MBP2290508.1 Ni/Co efflux regulator RcnB [Azospirillum rugosum]MDQ0525396.1 Ni/Co efflux regulator RcnB [Azospirillum rugosum]
MPFAVLAFGSLLALSPVVSPMALAQQSQGQGWGGALDTLNRAVNPNANPADQDRDRDRDRQVRDDRRYEGSSTDDRRGRSEYSRYSDRDLQDRYERIVDEQREMQRERRGLEDEMNRRGIRR